MIIPLILQQIDMVDSDLKVGSSNAEGVYVKDHQLLQFDWSKLQSNLSYVFDSVVRTDFPLMIANLSSHQIYLYRDNQLTVVEPGKIDWYTVGYNENPVSETVITNPNDIAVRAIGFHSNGVATDYDYYTTWFNKTVQANQIILQPAYTTGGLNMWATTLIVLDE